MELSVVEWKKRLEPELTAIHGVLSVDFGKFGLWVYVADEPNEKKAEDRKNKIYEVFEEMGADELPMRIIVSDK